MGWKDIKRQAIINEMDKLFPGERRDIIKNRYCLRCWRKHEECECRPEDLDNMF